MARRRQWSADKFGSPRPFGNLWDEAFTLVEVKRLHPYAQEMCRIAGEQRFRS